MNDSWFEAAACRGKHADLWFPPQYGEDLDDIPRVHHNLYYDVARMVCDRCDLRSDCEVLGVDEEYGMWGGRSPHERRKGSPFASPKRELSYKAIRECIPEHSPAIHIGVTDMKSLRSQVIAVSVRKTPVSS